MELRRSWVAESPRASQAAAPQKATLLSLEAVEEAAEYWGGGGGPVGWRLSAADVRHVLRQRVDFAPEDIAALTL